MTNSNQEQQTKHNTDCIYASYNTVRKEVPGHL